MKLLIVVAVLGAALFVGQPAECGYCPTYTCYGSCISPCVCLTPPGEVGGSCYGVERAPELIRRGWRLAE